jgi:serine/threonine protein kinase
MDLLPTDPESVGPYRLECRLGGGGQGTVYLGAASTGEPVAVKLLHPHLVGHDEARTRFVREMQIAERVAPFCTAQVLDSGVVDGRPYIASEFVDGPSLQESVRETGPRGGAALERLAVNTVTALAAIHRAGVVQRDFKPGNVLLGPDGPVVIDFGIARALDLSQSIITSQAVGTPGYMAPEQIREDGTGPEADLFAWAATMVFAATGERPFRGGSIPAVMQAILQDEPVLDGLREPLRTIVRECLAKDPSQRPTAADVGDRLRALPPPAWETKGSAPTNPDLPPESRRKRGGRRRPLLFGAIAASIVGLAGGAYLLLPSDGDDRTPAAPATPEAVKVSGTPTSTELAASPSAPASGEHNPTPDTSKTPATGPGDRDVPAAPPDVSAPRTTQPATGGEKKETPSSPKTLGTISGSDAARYCKSRGHQGAVHMYNVYSCYGAQGRTTATVTEICRWKYPSRPNVEADGSTCKSY